jgi:hypothetical protein
LRKILRRRHIQKAHTLIQIVGYFTPNDVTAREQHLRTRIAGRSGSTERCDIHRVPLCAKGDIARRDKAERA